MKFSCLSLLVFTCIFVGKADAQAGYIITQKGDTVKGEFKSRAFGRPEFKAQNSTGFVPINLDTLKELQLKDSTVFVIKSIPLSTANMLSKPQPLHRLERGRINLYAYVAPTGDHITTWYASKDADTLVALKTSDIFLVGNGSKKSRKKTLSDMFADQPDLQAEFNSTGKFDFATIRVYIRKYNRSTSTQNR